MAFEIRANVPFSTNWNGIATMPRFRSFTMLNSIMTATDSLFIYGYYG